MSASSDEDLSAIDSWNAVVTRVPWGTSTRSGPLEHLRLSVKDTFETAGVRTTAGTRRLADHIPTRDADAVGLLLAGGAQLVGKTNTSPLAGDFETTNRLFGRTRNPWGGHLTVGGSSGGSAVAVATGLADIDLVSDTVGSGRLPAHFCGVFAYKPTFGRIPTRGHIPPAPGTEREHDHTTVGIVGAELADVAGTARFLLSSGRPAGDASTGAVRAARVAMWHSASAGFPVGEEVADALRSFGDALGHAGVRTEESDAAAVGLDRMLDAAFRHVGASTAADLTVEQHDASVAVVRKLGEHRHGALLQMIIGSVQSHREWLEDEEQLARARHTLLSLLTGVDAIVCPVAPMPAYPHLADIPRHQRSLDLDGTSVDYFLQLSWCVPASVFGLPAVVIPTLSSSSGLPIGIQLIGRPFHDEALLSFAELVCARLDRRSAPVAAAVGAS